MSINRQYMKQLTVNRNDFHRIDLLLLLMMIEKEFHVYRIQSIDYLDLLLKYLYNIYLVHIYVQ